MMSVLFLICLAISQFSMAHAGDLHASDAEAWQAFGSAVVGAGDVNGDGFDDVLVGAYGDNDSTGALYLF